MELAAPGTPNRPAQLIQLTMKAEALTPVEFSAR
jgi:hypothetical protein